MRKRLSLIRNSSVLRQAQLFADRVRREGGADPGAQVERAYRLALGRRPTGAETARAAALVREHGVEHLCWVLLNASEFLYLR